MAIESLFTNKEKALICVSASIAAGCQPCTEYHVNGAHRAGACDRSIALAIETALAVRESSTRNMDGWARRCAGARPELDCQFRSEKRLFTELAAVAAAAAVNSVPDVIARVDSARLAGATREQISATIAIAASIRGTAARKVEAALGETAPKASTCCESGSPAARTTGCGCGR